MNAYHSRLKRWIRPFNGVSSKYLPNYLVWFPNKDSIGNVAANLVAQRILEESHQTMVFTQV